MSFTCLIIYPQFGTILGIIHKIKQFTIQFKLFHCSQEWTKITTFQSTNLEKYPKTLADVNEVNDGSRKC